MACIKLKLNFHREGGFIQQNPSMGEGRVTTVQIGQRKIHYKISSPHSRKHQSQFHPLLTSLNQSGYYGFHWTICSRHLSRYSTCQIPGYFDFQEANEAKKRNISIFCLRWQIPRVGTKKEGKCPVLHQHCNIFH